MSNQPLKYLKNEVIEDLTANVGMDAAVGLGDPALWKQAIEERLKSQK